MSKSERTYVCFNCNRTFNESEKKLANVPNNFIAIGTVSEITGKVDQCPHCDAVAFFGFSKA